MVGETIPLDLMPAVEGSDRRHSALPDRSGRGDLAVQLPAQPGRAQAGAGDRGRLLDRPQAAVQGPAHDADRRRDRRRGRPARGRGQHPADDPRARRSDGRGRAVQAAHLHRLAVGRLADEGAGGQEEGRPRARRQRRGDRRQDRRPRLGGPADPRRCASPTPARSASASSACSSTRTSGTRSWPGSSRAPASSSSATRPTRRPTSVRWSTRPRHRAPSAGSTRRSRSVARSSSAARPTARSSRRRS